MITRLRERPYVSLQSSVSHFEFRRKINAASVTNTPYRITLTIVYINNIFCLVRIINLFCLGINMKINVVREIIAYSLKQGMLDAKTASSETGN